MSMIRNRMILFSFACWLTFVGIAVAQSVTNQPAVTVSEDATSFSLSNNLLTARVSKRTGDLTSLIYKNTEILTDKSGHEGGYWSHDASGGKETLTRITWFFAPNRLADGRQALSVLGSMR